MSVKEIKFRAWDEDRKEMVKDYSNSYIFDMYENIAPTMLYTGFKDINKKEIYEDDIVKLELDKRVWIYTISTIEGFGNSLYLVLRYRNFAVEEGETIWGDFYVNERRSDLTPLTYDKYEVIGNVFENPDLLEIK